MKSFAWLLVLFATACCYGQVRCAPRVLSESAAQIARLQEQLKKTQVDEMDTNVPPAANGQMGKLKDLLVQVADVTLACASPSADPAELQRRLEQTLHANPPEPGENEVISKDDHRFDEASGSYGHDLRVQVRRVPNNAKLVKVQFSINVECGNDNMLLLYESEDGVWKKRIRWQAPKLDMVKNAFGDFFLSAIVSEPSPSEPQSSKWLLVVAHGTPWCTSRFSGFHIDLLSPGSDPKSPHLLWHIERGYSRLNFEPRLTSTGNTFELRLNAVSMDPASFERRVIYRYRVDDDQHIQRIGPIASNARGFVEEWIDAPWQESQGLTASDNTALRAVHDEFNPSSVSNSDRFVMHTYGPVRACTTSGVYQVQIDSTLEIMVPGKPGGDSKPLATRYFHVREVRDGYQMLSAPTEVDSACKGADLMPPSGF